MNYLQIEKVIGREILDSRGNPTVEAEVLPQEVLHPAAHPPANSRRWNCVTATRHVIWARA